MRTRAKQAPRLPGAIPPASRQAPVRCRRLVAGTVVPLVAISAGIVGLSTPALAVSAVTASPSPTTAGATATYTVTFTATTALARGSDTITLTGPTGTAFSATTTDYQVIDDTTPASATASIVTANGTSVTITTPIAVAVGDSVQVTANNATNPTRAGSYTLSVATSQDATPKVAQAFFVGVSTIGFATGEKFPDELTGGPFVASEAASILLVDQNAIPASVADYLSTTKADVATAHLFGGDRVLTTSLQGALETALGI